MEERIEFTVTNKSTNFEYDDDTFLWFLDFRLVSLGFRLYQLQIGSDSVSRSDVGRYCDTAPALRFEPQAELKFFGGASDVTSPITSKTRGAQSLGPCQWDDPGWLLLEHHSHHDEQTPLQPLAPRTPKVHPTSS